MLLRAAVRWRTVAAAGGACAARAWARCEEDLYATLGVGRKASAEEIRRAYKLRAAKAHPDHGGDAEEFKRVAAAYAVLSDDAKRRRYDAGGGAGGPGSGGGGGFPGGGFPGGGSQQQQFDQAFRLFEEMFGGGGGGGFGGGGRRRGAARIAPREVVLRLSLSDLFEGGDFRVAVPRVCRGRGTREERDHSVSVSVKPGAAGGESFFFRKAGDDVFYGSGEHAGRRDVTVIIEEAPRADLQRLGDDLLVAKRVSLLDALTGFAVDAPTVAKHDPRGRTFRIAAAAEDLPVAPDDVWVVKGEGMRDARDPSKRGDLFVRFIVDFPKALPEGDWKARRRALAGLIGGAPDAPAAQPRPASGGLFAGLFSGLGGAKPVAGTKGGEPAGAVASRASKAKVDALYRRRPRS
ncbi:hypothetical protein AURANDRAFT_23682 [Aureococcus anophagefferens]|uniref:J domain-containing protein n=1 Tax=Aureococcus anophagefferens TaxID=44056 RepID=F0Y408_AURAN|nr:hypothetical protein AURANDRAFT_23682 [Aureococcus anophagefferens]EGB10477.1 hypothetical protein AURANDRAFT_23682 [Aureococcus anophagefferens]|eukprot:XP_009035269.1 hypothetical protein AURANDRAFT_23682 [Aureococcus anophagefferens]